MGKFSPYPKIMIDIAILNIDEKDKLITDININFREL